MRLFCLCLICLFVVCSGQAYSQSGEPNPSAEAVVAEVAVDILPESARLLGEGEDNGVVAAAYLFRAATSPQADVLSDSESQYPYLLFVRFIHSESNLRVEKGLVAFKIENIETGEQTAAVKMEVRNGYFVSPLDIESLRGKQLLVGSKLEDDNKRQYSFPLSSN